MPDPILDEDREQEAPVEPPKYSGLLQNIFPDGTIEYDGTIGTPDQFPLTEAELAEVGAPGELVPSPPRPDYLAFWGLLLGSGVYAAIREQAMISLPMNTLATEFIALIGDAKAGRPIEPAIGTSMAAILTTGTFTAEQIGEFHAALVAAHLADTYQISGAL
jgi:hypothetical protein